MQVMVNGLLTHYERTGTGPLLLVLHGWGDDSRGWVKVQKFFSRTHTVITPDLPGFGGTAKPDNAWGLDEYAAFLQDFLQKIDVSKPTAILAHSNGGAIALRALADKKLSTDKLILLGSAGIRTEYKGKKKALRLIAKTAKLPLLLAPAPAQDRIRRKVYASIGSDMFVAEGMQETFKKIVTDDIQPDAAKVSTPTLLIYGEQDVATPVRYGKKLEQLLPSATLMVVPNAEHFVHQDQFAVVMSHVEEFLV